MTGKERGRALLAGAGNFLFLLSFRAEQERPLADDRAQSGNLLFKLQSQQALDFVGMTEGG